MDTMYFHPQFPRPQSGSSIFRYVFMSVVLLFSVVTLFFLPVDFAAIQMSLDPGFTVFFILVLIVFITKLLCLADFYLILFGGQTAYNMKMISLILQVAGSVFLGVSLLIIAVEIYILTNSFLAVLVHPFVIDFFLFIICNGFSYIVMNEVTTGPQAFAYIPVPQAMQQPKMYSMAQFNAPQEPQVVEMPSVKYPELPLSVFTEQMPMSYMPKQAMPIQPEPAKVPEQPKTPMFSFVPYYVMSQGQQ